MEFPTSLSSLQYKVSAQFYADGGGGTWGSSTHLWFILEIVGGQGYREYYEWFGNYWNGPIVRDKTLLIEPGHMYPWITYTIKATIRVHCENQWAYMDFEIGPPPFGKEPADYDGYAQVLKIVVEAP